ncbi:hypothetical protein GCM10027514_01920 [Azotobacter armeniacus]
MRATRYEAADGGRLFMPLKGRGKRGLISRYPTNRTRPAPPTSAAKAPGRV